MLFVLQLADGYVRLPVAGKKEAQLAAANLPSQVCEKGARNHPLTEEQTASNKAPPQSRNKDSKRMVSTQKSTGLLKIYAALKRREIKSHFLKWP